MLLARLEADQDDSLLEREASLTSRASVGLNRVCSPGDKTVADTFLSSMDSSPAQMDICLDHNVMGIPKGFWKVHVLDPGFLGHLGSS